MGIGRLTVDEDADENPFTTGGTEVAEKVFDLVGAELAKLCEG
jgi:hypothetical protein